MDSADTVGVMAIVFWRTTNMNGPLQHVPLAMCDPTTVDRADRVPLGFRGFPNAIPGRLTYGG